MYVPYHTLPDDARVWVYQSNRKFTEAEEAKIAQMATDFINQWTRHGENVKGSFAILHHQFLVIAVDQNFVAVSGCAIDASVKLVQQIQTLLAVDMLNKLHISYINNDEVSVVTMANFVQLVKTGVVNADTVVFNNLVDSKQQLADLWEVPAKKSWHSRFF